MRPYDLTCEQLQEMERRLKEKNRGFKETWSVSKLLDRIKVELNYKAFYGDDYETRGIKKAFFS